MGAVRTRNVCVCARVCVRGACVDSFSVDFSELTALPVREGYEPYGATAFFNADTKLVRIRWTLYVHPSLSGSSVGAPRGIDRQNAPLIHWMLHC